MFPPRVHVVLASPPCEGFSIAAVRWNFRDGEIKRGSQAEKGVKCVRHMIRLVNELSPSYFLIENPVGMLRTLDLIPYEMRTITQCQYGRPSQKPTDLWGGFPPSLKLKPPCARGAPCHAPAPRGSYIEHSLTKTYEKWKRSMIPEELSLAACRAAERDLKE